MTFAPFALCLDLHVPSELTANLQLQIFLLPIDPTPSVQAGKSPQQPVMSDSNPPPPNQGGDQEPGPSHSPQVLPQAGLDIPRALQAAEELLQAVRQAQSAAQPGEPRLGNPWLGSLAEPDRFWRKTVWTTDVQRFVLTPTGTGVGDKWVLSVCGARAARESH